MPVMTMKRGFMQTMSPISSSHFLLVHSMPFLILVECLLFFRKNDTIGHLAGEGQVSNIPAITSR